MAKQIKAASQVNLVLLLSDIQMNALFRAVDSPYLNIYCIMEITMTYQREDQLENSKKHKGKEEQNSNRQFFSSCNSEEKNQDALHAV